MLRPSIPADRSSMIMTMMILILVGVVMIGLVECSSGAPLVPAMFAFGDSIIDCGNNNFLSSIAKANYLPYGIDFNGWPSGRFTNSRTIIDLLGEKMGLPYLPPYADPTTVGSRIIYGVNYASAAAGVLDETGQHYGERFSLSQQVLNFENTLNELRYQIGGGANLTRYLAKSIAVLVLGSNDYINNYLLPTLYPTSQLYSTSEFANLLLNHYTRQLLALHTLGLRKFFIAGVGPLGCIPNQRGTGQAPPGRCLDYVNQMVGPFNQGLRALVDQLNSQHPGAIFAYGNTYGAVGDILNNPAVYGFSVVDRGCCGLINLQRITCLPFSTPCPDRNQFVFWDAFHATQGVYAVLAHRAFVGPQNDCYPINVQQITLL